jgi:excinuclease UvrABC nuclease subunit
MEFKKCNKCFETKLLNEFYKSNKKSFQSYCKTCNISFYKKHNSNCLYKIIDNNKIIYIGITKNIIKRKSAHLSNLKTHKTFNGSKISTQISMDEVQNWEWKVIMEDNDYLNLKIKEIELIVEHKPRFNSPYREFFERGLEF